MVEVDEAEVAGEEGEEDNNRSKSHECIFRKK
jgi:hypothetical protein